MQYTLFYETVVNIFEQSIDTKDKNLREKILHSLLFWYKRNFEELATKACEENDQQALASITNEVVNVSSKSDLEKLRDTYLDENYINFLKLSDEIFELAKKSGGNKTIDFDKQYETYYQKLKSFESIISPLFVDEYKRILSECILDLNLLKNGEDTTAFSFRYNRFING